MPKASVVTDFGPPEVLKWIDVARPEPGPTQIRIRVNAAGVGPTDLKIRRGELKQVFPFNGTAVLGFEAAGTVDACGSGVEDVITGDEVAAWLPLRLREQRIMPIELAAEAHRLLETGATDKKIVLRVS